MSKKGLGKFLAGAAVGVGIGMLFSPEKGEKNRKKLKETTRKLVDEIKNLDYEDVKNSLSRKIENLENQIKDLDSEKVASIAKEKGAIIKENVNSIYKEAVKQGKPVLEKYAFELREKTKIIVDDIMKKSGEEPKAEPKNETKQKKNPKN